MMEIDNSRIVIATNRLPVTFKRAGDDFVVESSVGGLATGVGRIYPGTSNIWYGWAGIIAGSAAEKTAIRQRLSTINQVPIFIGQSAYDGYYNGFCNKVLWPAFHGFQQHVKYEEHFWESYVELNERFAYAIAEDTAEDDLIWIQDFHLMLVPGVLRQILPDKQIGFFMHIPFPDWEQLTKVPYYKELLQGMLGADAIAFSTDLYTSNFMSSLKQMGVTENAEARIVTYDNRQITVDTVPMGIDYDTYRSAAQSEAVEERVAAVGDKYSQYKTILSIDRLDYIKGLEEKLLAIRQLLQSNPELLGQIKLLLVVVPSRQDIAAYQVLKQRVESLVEEINTVYGSEEWQPIEYTYQAYGLEDISTFYRLSDILLITSLLDGMNLVSMEYVASRLTAEGALVLSSKTGAATILKEAIMIDPFDTESIVSGILEALKMTKEDQQANMKKMQETIRQFDLHRWNSTFLSHLSETEVADDQIFPLNS